MAGKGNPKFVATDEQRKQAEMLAGFGLPQEQIASLLKVSVDTLDRHFRKELDDGIAKANGKVAQFLFQQATKNLTAAIFWAKTRMRWRETERVEHTGPDGAPMQFQRVVDRPIKETMEVWLSRQQKKK